MVYQQKSRSAEIKKNRGGTALLPLLSLVLAVFSMVLFLCLGFFKVLAWSWALILGGVLGLLFIGLYYIFRGGLGIGVGKREAKIKEPVEARVVRKKVLHKKEPAGKEDTVLLVVFQRQDGTEKKMNFARHKPLYHYYQTGDAVRFYPNAPYPEKLEKRYDVETVCIACGQLNAMDHLHCKYCREPLPKA